MIYSHLAQVIKVVLPVHPGVARIGEALGLVVNVLHLGSIYQGNKHYRINYRIRAQREREREKFGRTILTTVVECSFKQLQKGKKFKS